MDLMTKVLSNKLSWSFSLFLRKTGLVAPITLLFPLVMAVYWQYGVVIKNNQFKKEIANLQQQLALPLPELPDDNAVLKSSLSVTEYQQVRLLFDVLKQHHLQVRGSHYRFNSENENSPQSLSLDIPLTGNWMNLMRALQVASDTMPIIVDRLLIRRAHPESEELQISLNLTLSRGN